MENKDLLPLLRECRQFATLAYTNKYKEPWSTDWIRQIREHERHIDKLKAAIERLESERS